MTTTAKAKSVAKPATKSLATPKPKVKAIPDGMHTVTPYLTCDNAAAAIDFYKEAFGAKETGRFAGPDGKIMNALVRIFGSAIMVMDAMPEMGALSPKGLKGSPVTIHLYVEDVDAVVARAVKAGATLKWPVADQFWGDRYGQIVDPFGHHWSVATHISDPTPAEMQDAMKKMMSAKGK